MENPKETLPPIKEQIPNERLKLQIRQLIRDEKVSESEINEYIKVSSICQGFLSSFFFW